MPPSTIGYSPFDEMGAINSGGPTRGDGWFDVTPTSAFTFGPPTRVTINGHELPPTAYYPVPPETREEREYRATLRAEHERERAERRERLEQQVTARMQRQTAARERAEQLLRQVLLPDELAYYEETHKVVIKGSDGLRYRIADGIVSNVAILKENGERIVALCCHPEMNPGGYRGDGSASDDGLPHRDAHIAQILQLRHDAEQFWRKANVDTYDHQAAHEIPHFDYAGVDADDDF